MRPYMTEEEAKKKWCPMVRHSQTPVERACTGEVFGVNRYGLNDNPEFSRCIGSRCMAWGWFPGDAPEIGRTTKGRCEAPGGTS